MDELSPSYRFAHVDDRQMCRELPGSLKFGPHQGIRILLAAALRDFGEYLPRTGHAMSDMHDCSLRFRTFLQGLEAMLPEATIKSLALEYDRGLIGGFDDNLPRPAPEPFGSEVTELHAAFRAGYCSGAALRRRWRRYADWMRILDLGE
jgi:hypothetical protein